VSDGIVDLNHADPELPADLLTFIELGSAGIARAQAVLSGANFKHQLHEVELHAPWPGRRIACAGGNYGYHLLGMARNARGETDATLDSIVGRAREAGNWGFWKVPAEVAGPGDDVPYPARAKLFDYEGEVAIVLGKRAKNVAARDIADYVWGVTLLNDWSIRDSSGPARAMSLNLNKNFDGSTALGPSIVIGELDPQNVDVQLLVNDELRQNYNTKEMIFSFGELLEYLSVDFTMVPGDIISGGTAAGTAADSTLRLPDGTRPMDLFLKRGDVVEVTSPAIGTLRNRVV
jgi:2-keto-4-pentenoate hydratase/2-oxohepta-3-ene-1,7-dioic acid hydratase in catechol pathway